jgi:hypothetical protein
MFRDRLLNKRRRFVAFHAMLLLAVALAMPPGHGADFAVRTPNNQFAFQINGVDSLTLTLVRGQTYVFDVQTSPGYHPFNIYSPGVDMNGIESGAIRYTVPMDEANYYYDCLGHTGAMRGEIITVPPPDPPEPPTFRILSLVVGSNLVLTSTGTNGWTVNPEFTTNRFTGDWQSLTVRTNRLRNGTNEVICGRPPGNNVFIRLRAQPVMLP